MAKSNGLEELAALAKSRQGMGIRVEYRQQAHLGDEVHPVVYVKDGIYTACINDTSGKPYAVVELKG